MSLLKFLPMTNNTLKIWLIDDHSLFRTGFKTLLSQIDNVKVTFEASNGSLFLEQLNNEQPDLVFLDISMPNIDGITATQIALNKYPNINIIILSMFGEREYYTKLVEHGIKGFLLKSCDFNEVVLAIESVRNGDFYFSQELLSHPSFKDNNKPNDYEELSERERKILSYICDGKSNQEIGEKLFISKRTVEKHRANLMLKTNCSNTASLVVFAVKNGLYTIK